jgi:long-chain fatty acid transport protein
MNTDYDAPTFGFQPTGVDLAQLFVAPTMAMKIAPNQALGASAIVAYQRFQAEGVASFGAFSSDPASLSNNGYDSSMGYGLRVGYLGEFGIVSAGASYQTKLSMGEFDEYAGLFAEGGGFDIPSTWRVGLALKPSEAFTVSADYETIHYSDVPSVNNPLFPNLMTARLGDDGGAGFGWQDIAVWKLGAAYAVTPSLTLRGGFSSGEQPIPESEVLFNILAPGVIENHVTGGFSYRTGRREWNVAIVRALSESVTGPNPLEVPGQQQIELRMDQWEVVVGVGF